MTRTRLLAVIALCTLVNACTTAPTAGPQASGDTPTRAPQKRIAPKTAGFSWPAERTRIAQALEKVADVRVQTLADGTLQLLIPGASAFGRDEAAPQASLRATLDALTPALGTSDDTEILVLGHTDSIGSELYNLQLSAQRAEAVMEYLRVRGIELKRLHSDGRGEAEPIADNGTPEGRAINRRVEIIVRPLE